MITCVTVQSWMSWWPPSGRPASACRPAAGSARSTAATSGGTGRSTRSSCWTSWLDCKPSPGQPKRVAARAAAAAQAAAWSSRLELGHGRGCNHRALLRLVWRAENVTDCTATVLLISLYCFHTSLYRSVCSPYLRLRSRPRCVSRADACPGKLKLDFDALASACTEDMYRQTAIHLTFRNNLKQHVW